MIINLDLPDGLVNRLTTEAQQMGLSLSEYLVHLLSTPQTIDLEKKLIKETAVAYLAQGTLEQVLKDSGKVTVPARKMYPDQMSPRRRPRPVQGKAVSDIVIEQRDLK